MKIRYIFLTVLFSYSFIFAQGYSAVPFLTLDQSPLFNGAARIGTAVPMQDPTGFYYNPAQLGYYSLDNNFSVLFMPDKTVLLNVVPNDVVTSNSYAVTAGYNFKTNGSNIPFSLGIGYLHNILNYNSSNIQGAYDSFDCFSIGACYDYYLLFNLGFSIKSFTSNLGTSPISQTVNYKATGTAFDLGAMIIAPFDKLFLSNTQLDIGNTTLNPILKATVGYSISNLGKEVYYVDPSQSDPLPRTARLGYNLNLGFKMKIAGAVLPVIDYSFTVEAEDLLINPYVNQYISGYSYKGILGDINIGKNLIQLKGDDNVLVHKGHIFNFFKTLTIVSGSFSGQQFSGYTTNGWAVSTEGLFNILDKNIANPVFNYLFEHFNLEYFHSENSFSSVYDPKPDGIAVYFKGVEF
jgi:hypothetical protein